MDGLILVDKDTGPTSHDVVARLRRNLGGVKTGHFGTLDPLASGLLLVAVGKATRFNPFYSALDKSYEGRIRLGFATDTFDAEGRPASPPAERLPEPEAIRAALLSVRETTAQTPPPFSAKKFAGKPLYRYARAGHALQVDAVPIVIRTLEGRFDEPPFIDFSVQCSSGTYIRSLAHDLGRALGCGAHLASLRRTRIGDFSVSEARSLAEVEGRIEAGRIDDVLIALDALLPGLPEIVLDAEGVRRVADGRSVPDDRILSRRPARSLQAGANETAFRLSDESGRLVAVARLEALSESLAPFIVLIPR